MTKCKEGYRKSGNKCIKKNNSSDFYIKKEYSFRGVDSLDY
jgi:hypothetical protein